MATHRSFSEAAAIGIMSWWRSVLVWVLVVVAFVVAITPMTVVLGNQVSVQQRGFDPYALDPVALGIEQPLLLWLTLLPFPIALVALLFGVRYLHKRAPATLVSGYKLCIRWRRVGLALAIWTALLVLGEYISYLWQPDTYKYTFEPATFWPSTLCLLALLPLQIAFEEIAVRGYLHQIVCYYWKRPIIGVLVSSLIFGALHFSNPEVAKFGLHIMAPYYIGVGIFLATISVLDNGLELALGIHLATNVSATVLISLPGSALPTSPIVTVSNYDAGLALGIFAIQATLFIFAFAKTSDWSLGTLTQRLFD